MFLRSALLASALAAALPAHAITSTSNPSNWEVSDFASATGMSNNVLDGVAGLLITTGGGALNCSGSLLSGGAYVLTAAHCVTNGSGALNANSVQLSFASGATASVSSSSQISVFNTWNGTLGANNDLALLRLDTAVTSISGYQLYGSDPMSQAIYIAGYGLLGTGNTGASGSVTSTLHWGMNEYEATYGIGGSYIWDFDNGTANQNTLSLAGLSSTQGLGALEGNIASGDSGGPSFIQLGQQLYLVGVHSFGLRASFGDIDGLQNSSFGEMSGDTVFTTANSTWINSYNAPAAVVPEPATWAMGLAGLALVGSRRRKQAGRRPA